jgi:Fe-S-cluster containining protein
MPATDPSAVPFRPFKEKAPLPVPPGAKKTHEAILRQLLALSAGNTPSCLTPEFKQNWGEVLALTDRYQREIAAASPMTMSCSRGCAACCRHWVEDVNSFEAEIIAEYVKVNCPGKTAAIMDACRYNEKRLGSLNALVEAKLAALGQARGDAAGIDPVDLLLASYYRLRLACPLLEAGACLAYPVRPLTCRMYVSFSLPSRCAPDSINTGDVPTYLFDLEDAADAIIDKLHFKFMRFQNDTGLQSLLPKYLSL